VDDWTCTHYRSATMALRRVELSLATDEINGPFPTADAVSAVGADTLSLMSKTGGIFWADHSKQSYYSFGEINSNYAVNTPWTYKIAHPKDECSVQYGRVKIMQYDSACLILDCFTRENYVSRTLQQAFEIAVYVVHFYPDDRVLPDVDDGKVVILPKVHPTKADFQPVVALEQGGVWVDNSKVPVSLDRTVTVTLADAVSLLYGEKPSIKLLADIAMTYPQALVATYGSPLICYNRDTTILSVAQSITSLALTLGINPHDAFDTFSKNKSVGSYAIVGGWGYNMMMQVYPDMNQVAAIDLALAYSSSPEITRATVDLLRLNAGELSDG